MRRLSLLILLCMCATFTFGRNESVAAISFNPSRLGAYTHLKAVSKATLTGGVDTTTNSTDMNIKSQGTVSISDTNGDHTCVENSCSKGNLNTITNLQPVSAENGQTITTSAAMTKAVMKKANDEPENNEYTNEYTINGNRQPPADKIADQGTNITLKGGTLEATTHSYIHNFTANVYSLKQLEIAAKTLEVKNDFHAKQSFTLGEIEVTPPTVNVCKGTESKCVEYKFIERLNTKDNENQGYKVLAVKIKE